MTSPYPAASTPVPSVHNAPNQAAPKTISPEYFLALFESIAGGIAVALSGVSIDGIEPLFFLRSFGEALEAQAAQALNNSNNTTDAINNGLTNGSSTGTQIPTIQLLLQELVGKVDSQSASTTDLWGQVQNIGGLMLQVIQQLDQTPILLPENLLGAVWFWFGGMFNTVLQSVSGQNPAVVSLANQVAAHEATLSSSNPSRVDQFTDPTMAKWGVIGSYPEITSVQISPNVGFVPSSSAFAAGQFTASTPATGNYLVQAAATAFAYGRSRLIAQSDSGFTNPVVLEVNRGTDNTVFSIGTAASLTATLSPYDSHTLPTGGFKDGCNLAIHVNEAAHEFKILKDNGVIAVWNDGAHVIGTGSTHRNLALCTNIDSNPTLSGCGWTAFSQADIPT